MATQVANFTILTLPEDGLLAEDEPHSAQYRYVASAVNIALAMLESRQGRDALVDLTNELDAARPPSLGEPVCHGDSTAARTQVDLFLGKIRARFPPVVINHMMTDIDNLGVTMRAPWDGSWEEFNPRVSMIYLNGAVCYTLHPIVSAATC